MKNLWEVWTGVLTPGQCTQITGRCKAYKMTDATIGFENGNREDTNYRSSSIAWLDPFGADKDIADLIMSYVRRSNRSNFGFDITTMNEIQYTEYYGRNNGKYDWHNDVYFQNEEPYDRKLSVSIQLSDPSEYAGGQFEFFNMQSPSREQWSPQGSILIFPSFYEHRVTPVGTGTRRALVSWIEGPKWR